MSRTQFKKTQTTDQFARAQEQLRRKKRLLIDPTFNPLAADDHICCGPSTMEPPKPVVLQVPAGSYEVTGSRFPLARLAVEVLKHRAWHWLRGDGFRD